MKWWHRIHVPPMVRADIRQRDKQQQEGEAVSLAAPAPRQWRRPAREWWLLGGLLVLALVVRLYYAPNPGFFSDVRLFVIWGQGLDAHFFTVYAALPTANYPPLALYLCWFGVKAMEIINPMLHLPVSYDVFHSPDLALLEKLPTIACDLALVTACFLLARQTLALKWSLALAAAYAFSPAAILIGAVWGQMDIDFALFLVLAVWCAAQRHPALTGIFFALALMVKPQPLVLLPVLLVYVWKDGRRSIIRAVSTFTATCAIICLPYLIPPWFDVFAMLHNLSQDITGLSSRSAYNLWWATGLQGRVAADPVVGLLSTRIIGWSIFAAVLVTVCVVVWRRHTPVALSAGAAFIIYAFFAFTTGQHERYFFPDLPLFLLATLWQRRYLAWYAFSTAACYFNMLSVILDKYDAHSPVAAYSLAHPWLLQAVSWGIVLGFCMGFALFLRGDGQAASIARGQNDGEFTSIQELASVGGKQMPQTS